MQCDLLPPVRSQFKLICANLPYIPTETLRSLKVYQRDPGLALDGREDGLWQIRRLLNEAETVLALGGLLFCSLWVITGRNQAKNSSYFKKLLNPIPNFVTKTIDFY